VVKALLAGVDTLGVGFYVDQFDVTPEEWAELADAKGNSQGSMFDSGGSPVTFRGHKFSVNPKGSRGYEYVLVNDDVTIQLAERATGGSLFPEVHVTFRSQYLWRYGWRGSYTYIRDWVNSWAVVSGEKVSRADLCLDINLPVPAIDLRVGEVVSYARTKKEFFVQHHLKGLEETGYSFGQGDLLCRVYDKRAEIEVSSKAWFMDMWRRKGWDGKSPVTRVEFQARRGFLKSMQVETVEDLDCQLADLWKYFTSWVSLRERGDDSNRRRWALKPFWESIEGAISSFGMVTGVVRLHQRRPKVEALKKISRGLAVSLVAYAMTTFEQTPGKPISLDNAIGWFQHTLVPEFVDDEVFKSQVQRRAGRLAFMS